MTTKAKKIEYTHSREYRVFKALRSEVFPGKPYIYEGRYSWLLSPKGEPLELDILFPDVPMAVEVQGKQHQEPSKIFYNRREDWKYYLECDHIKVEACAKYNLPLMVINPDDLIDAESLRERAKVLLRKTRSK